MQWLVSRLSFRRNICATSLTARLRATTLTVFVSYAAAAHAQFPYLNGGPNSAFSQIDFAQMNADGEIWDGNDPDPALRPAQGTEYGAISALDLQAPKPAIKEFKRAQSRIRAHRIEDAIRLLRKAVEIDPKFVSAHNALGLAYLDQHDDRAKDEFQMAASLDGQFPGSFVNLGVLALRADDFASADSNFEKAASLKPEDPKILSGLAYAQYGNHRYAETLRTVQLVHSRKHAGMANVHYIAAAAAMSLNEISVVRKELATFLWEDPTNPLAPIARANLQALDDRGNPSSDRSTQIPVVHQVPDVSVQTFPKSERLRAQLHEIQISADSDPCETCSPQSSNAPIEANSRPAPYNLVASTGTAEHLFTIRRAVDETALFFSVSSHGSMINDLSATDIRIADDDKPPEKVLQFSPQSALPLRLGLLIDTSGSVERRFSFEKRAAEKFMEKVLGSESDLAFVAGFNREVYVTQDFSRDTGLLRAGIESLANEGETSLFDAVEYACWKLAAYPDQSRVAKVLVVLSDGEDNSSHKTLKQAIDVAEAAGITIYTLNTSEAPGIGYGNSIESSDANRVLKALADRSGGESIFPGNLRALDRYLEKLPEVIRSRYLIAYRPSDFSPNGKYRTVKVWVEKDGKRLDVHVRRGYYARLAMK